MPLKLLAEGEEALSDDEEVEVEAVAESDDADPVVLALDAGVETEPDLENSREAQGRAMEKNARG